MCTQFSSQSGKIQRSTSFVKNVSNDTIIYSILPYAVQDILIKYAYIALSLLADLLTSLIALWMKYVLRKLMSNICNYMVTYVNHILRTIQKL